jgi:uncharacterized membrane protein
MEDRTTFWIVRGLTVIAIGIVVFWLVLLYPILSHTGPSPGAGAQYVFVMLPSLAIAAILCLWSAWLAERALRRDHSTRTALNLATTAVATLVGIALSVWWGAFIIASGE